MTVFIITGCIERCVYIQQQFPRQTEIVAPTEAAHGVVEVLACAVGHIHHIPLLKVHQRELGRPDADGRREAERGVDLSESYLLK